MADSNAQTITLDTRKDYVEQALAAAQNRFSDADSGIRKQWFDSMEAFVASDSTTRYKLGIDIGGTSISCAIYEIDEKGAPIKDNIIWEKKYDTEKGIIALSNSYATIIQDAIAATRAKEGLLVGVGVGTPGRFIPQDVYAEHYGDTHIEIGGEGGPAKQGGTLHEGNIYHPDVPLYIAPGSAEQLGVTTDEFDGVNLRKLFEALTPQMMALSVSNDADVQMVGSFNTLTDDERRTYIDGKKVVYLGPGTGLGCGFKDTDEDIQKTDAHFSTMRLSPEIVEEQLGHEVSDRQREVYNILLQSPYGYTAEGGHDLENMPFLIADHLVTGAGLDVLARHYYAEILGQNAPDGFSASDLNMLYEKYNASQLFRDGEIEVQNITLTHEEARKLVTGTLHAMTAVGEWTADLAELIHLGKVNHRRLPEEEWTLDQAALVQNFDTLLFGGGVANGGMFKNTILKTVQKELSDRDLNIAVLTSPENAKQTAQLAAAQTAPDFEQTIGLDKEVTELARIEAYLKDAEQHQGLPFAA